MMDANENKQHNGKNENIIVWLDFDAYSYTNFAIICELDKLAKFNFIGIVTTKQDMSFFENQKIVKFEKLVYYPECYINKTSYNINNLKRFEEKYSLKLWLDIFSERSFYKYWTDFHKFSKEEIYSIVENSISFFIDILNEYKPKLILTQHIGENISNLLLYKIAENMRIKTLMPVPVHMHNKIIISDNLIGKEISDEFKKLMKNYNSSLKNYDEDFIKKQSFLETINLQFEYTSASRSFSQKIKQRIKRFSSNPEPIYKNIDKTKLNMLKFRVQSHFKTKKRKKFLDKNAHKTIGKEKFLYFPLQSEPEAKPLTTAPFYVNQITLIENIAKSIPIDFVLYVKEHPIQKTKLWRSVEDYKNIIKIPNVKFIHPDVSSQELISKSFGVITVLGSTGFEALFYKKPVFLFAEDYYDELSMITKINSFSELSEKIKKTLMSFNFNNKEMNALMDSFENQSISIPYFSIIKDGIVLSSIQRFEEDHNLTMKYFGKFYKKYEKSFELMAKTIHKKIGIII